MELKTKPNIYLDALAPYAQTNGEAISLGLELLTAVCHRNSYNRGWWHDPVTGASLIPNEDTAIGPNAEAIRAAWFPYVIATKIALIHSEVSEGLEAYRVGATDDKIPFPGITAEMGDAVIRIADLIGCLREYEAGRTKGEVPVELDNYDLGAAILAKLPVNVGRPDHSLEARTKPGGKKF